MDRVRAKSVAQTEYLVRLWERELEPLGFALNSPRDPARRGSHISLGHPEALRIDRALIDEMAVLPDFRYPDNLRLGIAPLYTSFADLHEAVARIARVVREGRYERYPSEPPDHHLGAPRTPDNAATSAMGTPYDYQTDWTRIAQLIVHDALRTAPGERVLIHADPTYFPALTEAVRIEMNRAGAVELAVHMLHPPGLERVRRELRRREDPGLAGDGGPDGRRALRPGRHLHLAPDELGLQRLADRGDHQDLAGAGRPLPLDHGRVDGRRSLPAAVGALRRGALDRLRRPHGAPAARGGACSRTARSRSRTRAGHAPPVRAAGRALPSRQRRRLEGVRRRLRAARERPGPGGRAARRGDPDGRHPADRGRPGDAARDLRRAPGRERAAGVRGQPDHAHHQRASRPWLEAVWRSAVGRA